VAERVAGKAVVIQINTRDNPTLAARFAVSGIPVMMLLRGGKAIDKLAGAQTAEAVLAWFHRQK